MLSDHSRAQLAARLITNKTGDACLRAGLKNWLVGDKTGTSGDQYGNANRVAVIQPSDRAPIIVAAYCEILAIPTADRNAVIAEIGWIVSLL